MRTPARLIAPHPALSRPVFWPWPSGQQLGILTPGREDEDSYVLSSDAVLFLWHHLAPSGPTSPWDVRALLAAAQADSMDDPLLSGLLRLLKRYKLADFDPQWAAWCKRSPFDKHPVSRPDLRVWPIHLSVQLADAWWYLQPFDHCPSWTWKQATTLCKQLTEQALQQLQDAGKADNYTRV